MLAAGGCLARPVDHRLLMSAQLGLMPLGRLGVVTRLASSGCGQKVRKQPLAAAVSGMPRGDRLDPSGNSLRVSIGVSTGRHATVKT